MMKSIGCIFLGIAFLAVGLNAYAAQTTQFGVSAPATGSFCQNMTVTVAAEKNSGATDTTYTSQITLQTSSGSGTWASTGTNYGTFTSGSNGTATYTFVTADAGTVTFVLNYPDTGATPITVKAYQTSNTGITGTSGSISFAPSGLLVTATAVSNPPASPPAAFSTPQIAGTSFTIYLTAYNPSSSCSGSGTGGIITSYTGAKTIRFYTTYVQPAAGTSGANTIAATINGTAIATSSGATATTKSITFSNGVATVTGNYNDVGALTLNVIDTATSGPTGASGNFVIAPYSLALNVPNNSASQTQTAAACLTDAAFASKAGDPFTANVQARNAGGTVTPNYGLESPAQGFTLTSGAIYGPTNARNGSAGTGVIGNGSTFARMTSGAPSGWSGAYFQGTTFSFDEVGCINLTAAVAGGSYLAAATSITATTVVGRFVPDHFTVSGNTPQFVTGSGSFTYLDQPFLYSTTPILTVTAQAKANTTTENYTGSFWKLTSAGFGTSYNKVYYKVVSTDTIPALNFTAPLTAPVFVDVGGGNASAAGSGSGTFTFPNPATGGFAINRLVGTLSPAFTAETQLYIPTITDSDGVLCSGTGCVTCAGSGTSCSAGSGFAFGTTASGGGIAFSGGKLFYHGRLVVLDANGPEILPLTMPMQTQYYTTAGGFVLNTSDSGSSGGTTFTGGTSSLILTSTSGLSTTATVGTGSAPYYFVNGILNITLAIPTGVTTGYVNVEANLISSAANLPWLQYNWPYSGTLGTTYANDPLGRGTFGIYQGNNRVIYQREVTQ